MAGSGLVYWCCRYGVGSGTLADRMTGSIVLRYRMRYLRRFQQKKGYWLVLGVMTRNPLLEISRAPLHFTLHMPNGLPVPKRE